MIQIIAGLALGLFTGFTAFVLKIWKEHTKQTTDLTEKMIQVVAQNAAGYEKLSSAINEVKLVTKENTEVTRNAAEATRQTKDNFSQMLIEVLRLTRSHEKSN